MTTHDPITMLPTRSRRKLLLLTAACVRSVNLPHALDLLEALADNKIPRTDLPMHARAVNAQFPIFCSTPERSLVNAVLRVLSAALEGAELAEEVADVLRYAEEVSLLPSS